MRFDFNLLNKQSRITDKGQIIDYGGLGWRLTPAHCLEKKKTCRLQVFHSLGLEAVLVEMVMDLRVP
jgi:hypothetical protein